VFFKCNNEGSIAPNLDIPNGDLDGGINLICRHCTQVKNTDKIIYVLGFFSNKLKKKIFFNKHFLIYFIIIIYVVDTIFLYFIRTML